MKELIENYAPIAIFFVIIWGLQGLVFGNGFFEGVSEQINAIGYLVAYAIKVGLGFVLVLFILNYFQKNS